MKKYITLTFIRLLCCFSAFSQHQTKNAAAYEISLNGQWQFRIDSAGVGETQQWYKPFGINFADVETIPGNWNLHNRYAAYTGKAWYKKQLFISKSLKGKLVRLYLEGVYNDAKVWVNGKFVMANDLGYLAFEKDISDVLSYGQQNTIVVCADNSFKVGALWNWGGIRRPVKLLVNDKVHIAQNHITPHIDLSNNTANIDFELGLLNKNDVSEPVTGKIELYQNGKQVASIPFNAAIRANETQNIVFKAHLNSAQVKLWSFDEPNMYNCKVTLFNKGVKVDERSDNFGLRKLELDNAGNQLKLNGKVVRAIGFDWVPDDRFTGNTLPLWRVKEDIDLMKSLGIRIARLSHMPFHKELLDYLDEKGILIFEEIPVWGYNNMVKSEHAKTDNWLRRMISEHYNHPCIAGWSVGNEIGDNKQVMDYVAGSIKFVKRQDSTRMGVMISHTAQHAVDPVDLSDIGFVNAYGNVIGKKVTIDHQMHPTKTLFLSEFGMDQLNEDLSADIPIKAMMDSIRNRPYLIGASLWTFNDYRSTYKNTKEYSQNRPWGLVDVFRQKKKAFYSFQRVNKPLAEMTVNNAALNNDKQSFQAFLSIVPRGALDLPSYTLQNYRITVKLLTNDGRLAGGTSSTLPVINPGDPSFQLSFNNKWKEKPVKATISLVSPLNYTLYDTTIYFEKPLKTPIINRVSGLDERNGEAAARSVFQVRYEKNSSASSYKLRYTINGVSHETPATIDDYITVPDATPGQVIKASLISMNSAGETVTEMPDTKIGKALLPPLIVCTEPVNGGFFAGFETWKNDDKFSVQVTQRSGNYNNARQVTAEVKGAMNVDSLTSGQTYYYRIKREISGGETSPWSEEIAVRPDGNARPQKPFIQGLIVDNDNADICFKPVKKSVSYELSFRSGKERTWHHELINAGDIDQYQFKIPPNTKNVEVRLAAINQYGTSAYAMFTLPGL